MSADDTSLFIDANKYLDLYRTDKGKKLLAPLAEQVDYIFVTQRVVDEVQRNKIQVAADYLAAKFKELKLLTFNVPDHLTGAEAGQSAGILQEMGDVCKRLKMLNSKVDALALGILEQISSSEDEVSKALAPIFERAIPHSQEEIQRARERREFGNPPGKASNPIGDQLTWEQILSHFQGKRRLWIISRDGDYGTLFGGKGFINRFLYEELQAVSPGAEAFLFADTVEGITHFVAATGVKAEKRLTPEEVEEIEKEEQSLPPLPQRFHSSEDLRGAIETLSLLRSPDEQKRRAMEAMSNLPDFHEQMRRAMVAMSNLPDFQEQKRRAMEAMSNLPDFHEQMRRAMEAMSNLPDIDEQVRRALRMSEQSPPSDEDSESNDEDGANTDPEDDDEPDNSTDDEQPK